MRQEWQTEERAELEMEGIGRYLLSTNHQAEPRQGKGPASPRSAEGPSRGWGVGSLEPTGQAESGEVARGLG